MLKRTTTKDRAACDKNAVSYLPSRDKLKLRCFNCHVVAAEKHGSFKAQLDKVQRSILSSLDGPNGILSFVNVTENQFDFIIY